MGLLDILRGAADAFDVIPGFDPVKDRQGLLSQLLRGRDQYGQTPPIVQPGTMQPANAVQKNPPMMAAPGGPRAAPTKPRATLPMARPVPGDFKTKTNFIDFLNPFKDTGQILQDDTARYLDAHNRYTAQQATQAATAQSEQRLKQGREFGLSGRDLLSYVTSGEVPQHQIFKQGDSVLQSDGSFNQAPSVFESHKNALGQNVSFDPNTGLYNDPEGPVNREPLSPGQSLINSETGAVIGQNDRPTTPSVSVTNNLPNSVTENAFQKKLGEQAGDARKEINVAGDAAAHKLAQASMMNALIDKIDYLGTGSETLLQVQKLGQMVGLNFGDDVAAKEAMKVLTNQMALALKEELPGPMSDGDRQFLQSIPANLGVTRSGNKALVFMMNKKAQFERDMQLSLLENNPQTAQEFDAWLQQFRRTYPPLFDEASKRDLMAAIGAGQ